MGSLVTLLIPPKFFWLWQWKKPWKLVNIWWCRPTTKCAKFLGHPAGMRCTKKEERMKPGNRTFCSVSRCWRLWRLQHTETSDMSLNHAYILCTCESFPQTHHCTYSCSGAWKRYKRSFEVATSTVWNVSDRPYIYAQFYQSLLRSSLKHVIVVHFTNSNY